MKNAILSIYFLFTSLISVYPQNPEWTVYDTSNSGLPNHSLTSLSIDQNDTKWIGTYYNHQALVKFDNTDWTVFNISNIFYTYFNSIAIDNNRVKWLGGGDGLIGGDGLFKYDDTSWTNYKSVNTGLPDDIIYSIAIDSSNNKWIGTHEGGLAKFDDTNWTVYNTSNSGLPYNGVYSIAFDNAGNKWIGTGDGVAKFDNTNWTVYNTSNSGLPSNFISVIAIDGSGNKWIGTFSEGLVKFDDINWTVYNSSNTGMPFDEILSLSTDGKGNIWIGTNQGLVKFNGTDWFLFNTSNSGLPGNYISEIAIDKNENTWIATYGGLAVYKEGGVVAVEDKKGKPLLNDFLLYQNYPNPFNPSTSIQYQVSSNSQVSLKVYDVLGNEVATLVNEEKPSGSYEVEFNASHLSSGIYFYQLKAVDPETSSGQGFVETKKLILMK